MEDIKKDFFIDEDVYEEFMRYINKPAEYNEKLAYLLTHYGLWNKYAG